MTEVPIDSAYPAFLHAKYESYQSNFAFDLETINVEDQD